MARNASLNIIFGADTTQLDRALGTSQKRLRNLAADFTKVGGRLTAGVTAPLLAMGANAVRTFANFEQAMASVKAVSGATGSTFEQLEGLAKELGRTTVFTAGEVANLQLEYSKLGFSANEIQKITESTLYLAQATGSDLAQSAEVAGATLRGFGLEAEKMTHLTDVMAASFSASALDLNSFQDAMKYVAPVAKAAGVSVEETTAMLGALANAGIKGSQAGTSLRMIFQQLASGGGSVQEKMDALAKSGLTLDAAFDEVGRRAQTALLVLNDNSKQVEELTDNFEKADGAAKGMADTMNDTTKGAIARMNSAVEGMNIAIGEALAPIVIQLTEFIGEMAQAFTELSPEGQRFILIAAGIAAALGPLLLIIGQVVALKANLAAAFLRAGQAAFAASGSTKIAATANTAAGNTAAIAAGKMKMFSAAMRAIPFAFMLAGVASFVNKVERAQQEVKDLQNLKLQNAANLQSYEDAWKELEGLDATEILRRIDELDALNRTIEELSGNAASIYFAGADTGGLDKMAQELIPRSVVQDIQKRTAEIQAEIDAGFETFGVSAGELATSEVLGKIRAQAKKQAQEIADTIATEEYSAAVAELQEKLAGALVAVDAGQFVSKDAIRKQTELANAYKTAAEEAFQLGETELAQTYLQQARSAEKLAEKLKAQKDVADDLQQSLKSIEAQQFVNPSELEKQEALTEAFEDAAQAAFLLGDTELAQEYLEQANAAKTLAEQLQKVADARQADIDKISQLYGSVGMTFDAATASTSQLLFALDNTTTQTTENTEEIADAFEGMSERIQAALQSAVEATAFGLGEILGQMAVGAASLSDLGAAFADIAGNLLQTLGALAIKVGTTAIGLGNAVAAIKTALASLNPAVAIAAGIALVALGAGVKAALGTQSKKVQGTEVPKFAQGGLVTGPTLAMVGDNASGKEAIIPFERMGEFLRMTGANDTKSIEVFGRLSGSDILLSTRRANYDFNRIHG